MRDHLFVWIDEDRAYVDGVMAFLQHSTYRDSIDLKAFTTLSNAEVFLQRSSITPLIIGTQQIMRNMNGSYSHKPIVILTEQPKDIQEPKGTDVIHLYKFQALSRLLTELCHIDKARKQSLGLPDNLSVRKTKLVGVFSAVGHCGKSTTALNLARSLAMKHHQVLYISFESIGSGNFMLQPEAEDQSDELFSQLMYFLKLDKGKFMAKFAAAKRHDPNSGIDYISSTNQVREMEVMSKGDVQLLIDTIVANSEYDQIVIDLESSLHPRTVAVLEYCDDVIWLIQDDAIFLHKTKLIREQIPTLNRVHFVVNKYTGRMTLDAATFGCEPSFFLPYIPEWKNISSPKTLLSHRVFQEAVSYISRELEKRTIVNRREN